MSDQCDQANEKPEQPSSAPTGYLASIEKICNSTLAEGIALSLIILSVCLGVGGCVYLERAGTAKANSGESEKAR